MEKTFCEKCGDEIAENGYYIIWGLPNGNAADSDHWDLCSTCMAQVKAVLEEREMDRTGRPSGDPYERIEELERQLEDATVFASFDEIIDALPQEFRQNSIGAVDGVKRLASAYDEANVRAGELERQLAEAKRIPTGKIDDALCSKIEDLERKLAEQVRRWKESEYVNLQIVKINAQLREALKFYGRHDTSCGWFRFPGASTKPCSCGFNEALAAVGGREKNNA